MSRNIAHPPRFAQAALVLAMGMLAGAASAEGPLSQSEVKSLEPQSQAKPAAPLQIEDLGNQRLRYGSIEIDKGKGFFSAPGRIIRTEPPLEYLAVKRNGSKAYESVIELDVDAVQFNFAAILIGLDASKATHSQFHFDKTAPTGDAVAIYVAWQSNGKSVRIPASELLTIGDKPVEASQWIYTGSAFVAGDRYLAEMDGTLIGFVHDPSSIIEHKEGVGLGNWGAVAINPTHNLQVGTSVVVTIERQRTSPADAPVSKPAGP